MNGDANWRNPASAEGPPGQPQLTYPFDADVGRHDWPNIGLLSGRLVGLGRSEQLHAGTEVFDLHGDPQTAPGGLARPIFAASVTPPADQTWLALVECAWPQHRLMLVLGQGLLVPRGVGDQTLLRNDPQRN